MKRSRMLMLVFAAAVLGTMILSQAKADEWDHKTIMTFNEPVELPGVVLPAGTYVFKLADSSSDRNIVQVFNKEEDHIYATILAIPDYRMEPTDNTVVTFDERPAGSPEAIKAWFYPGSTYGDEFVYPKPRAMELAKANNQPVPSMPAAVASTSKQPPAVQAVNTAPVTAIKPSGEEVPLAEVQPRPMPAPQLPALPTTAANTIPRTLPKTASPLPWFLLIGTASLTGSFALRLAAKKAC